MTRNKFNTIVIVVLVGCFMFSNPCVFAADEAISDLSSVTSPDNADLFVLVDTSATLNKNITFENFVSSILAEQDSGTDITTDMEEETHASEHNDGGADETDRLTEGVTMQAFTNADATPDVTNGATPIVRFWQTGGTGATTITDFDDGDDHSDFTAGDWFWLRIDDAFTTIDFSDNANIEGNANTDFTGSATQITSIMFVWDGTRWIGSLMIGMSDPLTLSVDIIQGAMNVITNAGVITLTAAQMGSIIVVTAAGDVNIPADQCDTATGRWLTVKSTAAHLNSVTSDDANDAFVLSDGTDIGNGDELDLSGDAGSQVTVTCLQANKWWVTGEIGTCTDGGGAD
jgi:hypothetical protein